MNAPEWTPRRFELTAITMMFRDVADKDYIAARVLFRNDLELQFLWSALQALEKYLKGILLYNGCDTRGLKHSLSRALGRVLSIEGVGFQLPPDLAPFLDHLEAFGQNRYLTLPHYFHDDELLRLDKAVWHVRRYCQYFGAVAADSEAKRALLQSRLASVHSSRWLKCPERFRIVGGYLEDVLQDGASSERASLVWNNLYFGSRARRSPPRMKIRSVSINPIHVSEPGVVDVLRDRVDFPKAFLRAIDEQRRT
jgi:hypothetical protein